VVLTLIALVLTALILAMSPFATPLYATAPVEVRQFEIVAGKFAERFLQIPQPLATAAVLTLLAAAVYLEFFAKMPVGKCLR
jgi:hypothetical protein